jgi:hypothetical protein
MDENKKQLQMIPLAVGAGQWLGAGISSHLSAGGMGWCFS